MKIVIDANVYVSSLMKPNGEIAQLLISLLSNQERYTVVASAEIFIELARVLEYPKVRNRIQFTDQDISNWLASMQLLTEMVNINHFKLPVIVIADPDDDKYILTALASKAEYIVSGDQHLLNLNPYQGIQIITARELMQIISNIKPAPHVGTKSG